MIERNASGFQEWNGTIDDSISKARGLALEQDRIDQYMAQFDPKKYNGLMGSYMKLANVDFFHQTPKLEWIHFYDCQFKNIDGVYALKDVVFFSLGDKRPGIDFSGFKRIKKLILHNGTKDTGIAKLPIEVFHLWSLGKNASYGDVDFPLAVKEIRLAWTNPPSLDGMPVLKKLKHLWIQRTKTIDYSLLPKIAPNLETLTIESNNVTNLDGITNHPKLSSAVVGTRLVVGSD